jgi:type II restriction/modification system DNA methylase subunit YeeA
MIDFGTEISEQAASLYEKPFQHVLLAVKPEREKNNREAYRKYWWRHGEPRIAMRSALRELSRFFATPEVSKHAFFAWLPTAILPDKQLIVFARQDDFSFGVLVSKIHAVWAFAQGTQVREKESGFRYTPTTCFETYPFPRPTPAQEAAIAAAAKELNELRERWLNPPEWTETRTLEFPGSVGGPWDRYIVGPLPSAGAGPSAASGDAAYKIGLVRYPRLEARDADCAAKLKKRTLTNLYNERPAWLDLAHKKLDAAVAAAYGWPADLTDEQILERLLALNLECAAEEEKVAKLKKPKTSRGKKEDELI